MSTSSLKVLLLAGMTTEHDTPHSTCYAGGTVPFVLPRYHTILDQKYRLAIDWT